MPDLLLRVANIASGSENHVLTAPRPWKFRFCPYTKGRYTIGVISNGAVAGAQHQIFIGTTEVVSRSDTTIGGADGVIPTPNGGAATNTAPFHQFVADKDDEVDLVVFETGAVATTDIMVWANVEPLIP
jgi:hypothetical protein